MPANTNPIFPAVISTTLSLLTDTVEQAIIHSCGPNGSRIDKIIATSTCATDVMVYLILVGDDATTVPVGCVIVPAGAGYSPTIPPVSLLSPLVTDADGMFYLSGSTTEIAVTLDSPGSISILCMAGDY